MTRNSSFFLILRLDIRIVANRLRSWIKPRYETPNNIKIANIEALVNFR